MAMDDETHWLADRANLLYLYRANPTYTKSQLALATGRSLAWVKKWLHRFNQHPTELADCSLQPKDAVLLQSQSRLPKCPPPPIHPKIVERILALRDQPPAKLERTPGPRTLTYYLANDAELAEAGLVAPRSSSTIYKILRNNGRYTRKKARDHKPIDRPPPLTSWQLDFKDSTSVKISAQGKQAHLVEILNLVDVGTSSVVASVASDQFNAETALVAIAQILAKQGLPCQVTFDRDPRWVGSHSGRDFPSAFVKFWYVLGVKPNICPPHRPDLNSVVERFHRNLGYECLKVHQPQNLAEVRALLEPYRQFYNYERPHQGSACANLPPLVANPDLPLLAGLPLTVDPDSWLTALRGKRFVRKVDYKGTIQLDKHRYYLGKDYIGKFVLVAVDSLLKQLVVSDSHDLQVIRRLNLKGLYGQEMAFADYLKFITAEARSERRLASLRALARAAA